MNGRILGAISASSPISFSLDDLRLAEPAAQRVVVHEDAVDLGPERGQVAQILHADGAPADLVLVGGPDAAAGGADLVGAGGVLADDVELAVQRQDERRRSRRRAGSRGSP